MVYDDFAARLAGKYKLFLFALAGRYLADVTTGVKTSPLSMRKLHESAAMFTKTFYSDATAEIAAYGADLYVEGNDAPLALRTMVLAAMLRQALVENINQVARQALVGHHNFASVIRDGHGSIGMLIQRQAGGVSFKLKDTAGRTWNAERLMYAVLRDYAYQSWLDSEFNKMQAAGYTLARPVYSSPDHPHADLVFSLGAPVPGYPTLAEIRSVVFHPNSTATVAHVST